MREVVMRTTVTLDDAMVAKAAELTGVKETSALVRNALATLIRVESARRLAALGGSDTTATAAPRRRRKSHRCAGDRLDLLTVASVMAPHDGRLGQAALRRPGQDLVAHRQRGPGRRPRGVRHQQQATATIEWE